MEISRHASLDNLRIADPDTHVWVKGRVALISPVPSAESLDFLEQETIWGLSQEAGLGRAMAEGLLHLMDHGSTGRLAAFAALVHQAAETGVTLARLVANYAAPVLQADASLLEQFQKTLAVMLRKGTYTLSAPLEVMTELITAGQVDSASAYLDLLAATFDQQISYNQSLRLVYLLPRAVRQFVPDRCRPQIEQLKRLACLDLELVEPFLEGMEKGLGMLDAASLEQFNTMALDRYAHRPEAGIKFLSLASKVGQAACAALQRAVALGQVRNRLGRYLNARMGRPVAIKALSELPRSANRPRWVCSDGDCIYLPDEVDRFENQADNRFLYKALVRLEAGYFECRTFDFDMERALEQYPEMARWVVTDSANDPSEMRSDGQRFLDGFFPRALGEDLFTIYEQARVAAHLKCRYPGLMDQVMPLMRDQADRIGLYHSDHLLAPVFVKLVLDMDQPALMKQWEGTPQAYLIDLFQKTIAVGSPVEATARLVCLAYEHLRSALGGRLNRYGPMLFPYDRRIRWDLVDLAYANAAREQSILRIKMRLQQKDLRVYRSDLRNRLKDRQGILSADDLVELVLARDKGAARSETVMETLQLDLDELLQNAGLDPSSVIHPHDAAARYPEWDHHLQDYLHDHTYVHEIEVPAEQDGRFYHQTLIRHGGLVTRMRRAFALLKPEGLTILRQWPEGDAFDYRALIDFAIDRRAGRIPSDRLFIKRLKQERDVAVLLLVDLSRSTANPVAGGHATVLDVAKEALVLFCEALQMVGDSYAIAGFSGTGRYAVDFYGIKTFAETLSDAVKARISVLSPQRSTRMGAAIRHATALLAKAESRVRLIIVVSDGFPNDMGYKGDYAIADTRRAVQEARSRSVHLKAITVNIGSDPRLDDLYGRVHHHVIEDVRDLPGKLLRLYGTLTRY